MIDSIKHESTLTLPSDLEIQMSREFRAPAVTLFDMWAKPEHVSKWYAVWGTTRTVCKGDLRSESTKRGKSK